MPIQRAKPRFTQVKNVRNITANQLDIGQIGGRRNLFYNPKFSVAQRGTSFSKTTDGIYTLDRWKAVSGSQFNLDTTITQSTTVPSGEGFSHSLKIEADSVQTPSGSANGGIFQKLETQDVKQLEYGTNNAKNLTLSFWVKSNKTGIYCVQLQTNQGNSTSSNRYTHVKEYTISSSNTWEKKILIFPGHTAQVFDASDNNAAINFNWWLATGSSDHVSADTWIQTSSYSSTSNQVNFMDSADNEWYLCGCQLEVGSQATPFEHRSFGEELALCQRYYNTSGLVLSNTTPYRYHNQINLNVEMRASPTITTVAIDSGTGGTVGPTWDRENNQTSRKSFYQGNNNGAISNARFSFSAEL